MLNSLHRATAICTLAAGLMGATACARTEPPREGGMVRIGVHHTALSLDPHRQNEVLSYAILFNIYDGLTRFGDGLQVEPALVESWENPDDQTWWFQLRRGVTFHDGRALTSADVVASLERARGPGSELGSFLADVDSVRAIDSRRVEVVTARPAPLLLNKLAFIAILPADAPGTVRDPVGTGAYRFVALSPDGVVELERDESSWHRAGGPRRLDFVALPDAEKRLRSLVDGSVDLIHEVPFTLYDEAMGIEGIKGATSSSLLVEYLHLRPDRPPFDDLRVRQAVNLALDREALVDELMGGHGLAATQMVSPGSFGFDPELEVPVRDLERARALLTEAGYPEGIDVELEYRESRRGELIAEQLSAAGIRVALRPQPWNEVYRRLVEGEIAFYYGGVVSVTGDASDVLDNFVHTRSTEAGRGGDNDAGYSNPELDRLIEEASATLDNLVRRGLLQRCFRLLRDDAVYLPLTVPDELYLMRADLSWRPRLDALFVGRELDWQTSL